MTSICPKCRYQRKALEDVPDWQCPACGIAYAKFQQSAEPGLPATPEEKSRMDFSSVLAITTGICALFLTLKGFAGGGVSMMHGLLLVPLFFSTATALSSLLCHDIYYWNKWEMQFLPYDKAQHPVMYRVLFIVSLLGMVVFTIFFFMLR